MTAQEQLARIALIKPPVQVKVYILESNKPGAVAGSWPSWLCPKHLELRKLQGYEVKGVKEPPHELRCDDANWGTCGSLDKEQP